MPCGLFGKLPARRDFVSSAAPRRFLDPFERWLQGCVAASRSAMGDAWQDAYLRMPIWRFHVGAAHTGTTAVGAFMPSVDAVGRYFPLSIFAVAEEGDFFPPPDIDANDGWYESVEGLLLSALEPGATLEALRAVVEGMDMPPAPLPEVPKGGQVLPDGAYWTSGEGIGVGKAVAAARSSAHPRHAATLCCLWTIGGEDYPAAALIDTRLPDPKRFPILMTGDASSLAPAYAGGWE